MMQVDLQLSFLAGASMAFVARDKLLAASDRWVKKARGVAVAFGVAAFAPTCLYITLRWTPWETMYVWDRASLPDAVLGVFLLGAALAALLGFHLTSSLIRGGRLLHAALVNAVVLASCAAIAAVGWERVGFVGTLEEFAAGERANILGSDLVPAMAVVLLLYVPVAWVIIRWLRRSDHEV